MSDTNANDSNTNNGAPRPAEKNSLVAVTGLAPVPANLRTVLNRRAVPDASGSNRLVWDALRRWWKVAIPTGIVLGAVAAVAAYLLFTPQYEAAARIRINDVPAFLAFDPKGEGAQSRAYVQTHIETLRYRNVIGPVLEKSDVKQIPEIARQDDPIGWLSRQIIVKQVGQSELYAVSFKCGEREGAAQVVNAVIDSYFKLREQEDSRDISQVVKKLEDARDRRAEEVSRLFDGVRQLAVKVTGKDPFTEKVEGQLVIRNPLSELDARVVAAEVEEEIYRAKVKAMEDFVKQPVEGYEGIVERNVEMDHEVQRLRDAITQMERTKETHKSMMNENYKKDARYQKLEEDIHQEKENLDKLREQLREQFVKLAEEEVKGKRQQDLAALRAEWENRKTMRNLLKERLDSDQHEAKKYAGSSVDLMSERNKLARAEKVLAMIEERIVRLRTEQGAPARVTLVAKAEVPLVPEQVFPFKTAIPAALVGLCLPMAIAVFREKLLSRIGDPESFEKQCNLKVVAEVSRFPAGMARGHRHGGRRVRRDLGMFEESIDSLRTSLALADHVRPLRILAVTSAVSDEGKTSIAVQLAVSLARATGHATLLIDADLRSPNVHKVFDVPLGPGLAAVLAGEITLQEAIVPIADSRLHVLAAGKLRGSPHRLLANGKLQSILAAIPAEYEHVIIDTPPVLAASEAQVLARSADGAVLCAMRDLSRAEQVRKASDRLASSGANLVGAVFNGVPTRQYAHRYGTYPYPRS